MRPATNAERGAVAVFGLAQEVTDQTSTLEDAAPGVAYLCADPPSQTSATSGNRLEGGLTRFLRLTRMGSGRPAVHKEGRDTSLESDRNCAAANEVVSVPAHGLSTRITRRVFPPSMRADGFLAIREMGHDPV